jgi:hypothetical protein
MYAILTDSKAQTQSSQERGSFCVAVARQRCGSSKGRELNLRWKLAVRKSTNHRYTPVTVGNVRLVSPDVKEEPVDGNEPNVFSYDEESLLQLMLMKDRDCMY